jgi:hypothetical protein
MLLRFLRQGSSRTRALAAAHFTSYRYPPNPPSPLKDDRLFPLFDVISLLLNPGPRRAHTCQTRLVLLAPSAGSSIWFEHLVCHPVYLLIAHSWISTSDHTLFSIPIILVQIPAPLPLRLPPRPAPSSTPFLRSILSFFRSKGPALSSLSLAHEL